MSRFDRVLEILMSCVFCAPVILFFHDRWLVLQGRPMETIFSTIIYVLEIKTYRAGMVTYAVYEITSVGLVYLVVRFWLNKSNGGEVKPNQIN
jgi:hypothetical protein